MSGYLGQFAVKTESVVGTAVTVDRPFEVSSAAIKAQPKRIEIPTIRAGARFMRHRPPYVDGASGSIEMPILTKGFGWWLKHMLGTSATGALVDSAYTHTGTIGVPTTAFTAQTGVPRTSGAAVTAQTAAGGKLTDWEISCAGGSYLMFKANADFMSWTDDTALVTPLTYPTAEAMTFIRGSITVDASPVISDSFSFKFGQNLETDRRGIGLGKREAKVNGLGTGSLDLEIDFEDDALVDKINSSTQTGATSAVVITIEHPALIGATSRPKLVITLPAIMWDGDIPSLDSVERTKFPVKGTFTDSALSIAYTSVDSVA